MADPAQQDLAALRQAACAAPESIDRWLDLCEAAERLKDYGEVLHAGDEIVRLAPDRPQPHFIRALALHRLDRIEEAIEAYRRVLELHPAYVDAWINLGECCQFLNRIAEAEDAYRHAVDASGQGIADEDRREIGEDELGKYHWNLALIELLRGDYGHGFARYPARFKAIAGRKRPDLAQPLLCGEDITGKTILVSVDQGHGDTLMMARYLPLLKARGAKVLFQVQPPLAPYLKGWNGADEILEGGRDALPPFDYHASEFDLPRYFGTSLQTVPAKIPYLPLPPPDDATRLPDDGYLKVALTWSGNPDHRNDKRRSVPLEAFEPLFAVKDVLFFALNRDLRPGDAQQLARHPVVDLAPVLKDFSASARLVNQMDLVISCDTSIAHLAGGMGKPVWVLLPFAPSWCWMLDRTDNPWYPTARLFRQHSRGDWGETMDRVATVLSNWVKQAKEKRAWRVSLSTAISKEKQRV